MTRDPPMRDDIDRLAAEHVLGLLEGEDAARAERLLASDRHFESLVATWRNRFAEVDDLATSLPSGEALWARIEAGLEAPSAEASAEPRPVLVPNPRAAFTALWRSLPFWRVAGLASAAAALALAVGLALLASRPERSPALIVVLLNESNRPAAVVNAFADGRAEFVPIQGLTIPHGHALELWTFAKGPNAPPVSVGLVNQPRTARLERVPRPAPDQLFAISVEPAGGSPTGQPTGPVLMKGTASTPL
jgi:anti-sigma-K factor RskA